MTDERKVQLLPCPWCGSHKVGTRGRCIECASCGASGPELPLGGTHKDMDALWNTRQAVAWMGGEGEAVGHFLETRPGHFEQVDEHFKAWKDVFPLFRRHPRADADARDAERYRLLKRGHLELWEDAESGEPTVCSFNFEGQGHDIDQAIDKALAAERGEP